MNYYGCKALFKNNMYIAQYFILLVLRIAIVTEEGNLCTDNYFWLRRV